MEDIEKILLNQVSVGEVQVSQANNSDSNDEFEECVDLLDPERRQKNYDWNSDISIPEFASHVFTQSSIDVGQYFQTRDFVETYLEDGSEVAKKSAGAAKELINRTLNRKNLHHYLKFVRGKSINNLVGRVYAKCWWERQEVDGIIGQREVVEDLDVDIDGNPMVDPDIQIAAQRSFYEDVEGKIPVIDQFNYDVWDQRNVFMSSEYVYSLQQKRFVTFRSEMTLDDLKEVPNSEYFNLDKLEEVKPPDQTKFKGESAEKDTTPSTFQSSLAKPYDIYERYGKFWIKDGKIGLDQDGKALDDAQNLETVITWAESESRKVLIGFREAKTKDAYGIPYRPILRGLCYVNMTEDGGSGDGKYTRELQIGIDDTFNVSQDRVMLATIPTLKTNKHTLEDNSTLYIEPGHNMEMNDPSKDVLELQISDNITGALSQIQMLTNKMQQVDAIQPPSMGDTGLASTSATAFAGASTSTNQRASYKSMTFENTFLCDLYWMIQQMTYQFATEQTANMLMGDKMYEFDPSRDYYYKPLSQSIEPEHSKMAKRKEWTTLFGYAAQTQHPDTVKRLNYIFGEIVKLMGDEYQNIDNATLDENTPVENGPQGVSPGGGMTSNQSGSAMSSAEMGARGI